MTIRSFPEIGDLPSCLMIDILSRVPIETLVICRFVCKSWFLLFSDPLFVRLHSARSPTCILSQVSELKRDLRCYKSVGEMVGKDFEIDSEVGIPDSIFVFTCENSCHGLLCLRKGQTSGHLHDDIYVCNPILGEYITIPIEKRNEISAHSPNINQMAESAYTPVLYVFGFSSRSHQFKVLQIYYDTENDVCMAEIYTIGDGTRQWKSIGIAPSCAFDFPDDGSALNGSVHWADEHEIVYFDFESEQFGSLPSPPALCGSGFKHVRVCVLDGCLCISAYRYSGLLWRGPIRKKWVMKEYGVEESWTEILYTQNDHDLETITYKPSFISLQDFAGSENVTVLSRTRTKDQNSPDVISNVIFQLRERKCI